MNFSAVEQHAYDNYCYPLDKDTLEINIKTGKDVTRVFIMWGDPFTWGIAGGKEKWSGDRVEVTQKKELQNHFWWTISVAPPFKRCRYYYELYSGSEHYYFLEDGFYTQEQFDAIPFLMTAFSFPWMNSADICCPPKWAENTVWYQIFPSRFAHGENPLDTRKLKPWGKAGQKAENTDEYGGNIQGIIDHLDYLADMGINGLYLNPVNLAWTQHKYDTTDYTQIDPQFGSKEKIRELIDKAHERGMRVMLDGVFNHSGWLFKPWQDILKNKEKSKYASWFMVNDYSFVPKPGHNAKQGKYYSFAFADYMPKLNTNNQELRDYILGVCEMWVKEYGNDALRLDVANELSHEFNMQLQERMRHIKSDFYIAGEIWHNALPWLRGREFDSVINYPLEESISVFALSSAETVKQFEQNINRCLTMYYRQTEKVLINQMDSHDTIRLVTKCGCRESAMQQLALMFAMPGSACIYYGTEILLEGGFDPDCRRCMPWTEIEAGKYADELMFMKQLIQLRKTNDAMRSINIEWLYSADDTCGSSRILRMKKASDDGKQTLNMIFNFSGKDICADADYGNILLSRQFDGKTLGVCGFVIY